MPRVEQVKLRAGKYYLPVTMEYNADESRAVLVFKYNKPLLAEVRMMEGRKWHGFEKPTPRKVWSIPITPRNLFQLDYLRQDRPNPYARYDAVPEIITDFERTPYDHQGELVSEALVRKAMIWAAEMGTGKTLAAIEVMERSGIQEWWWVGTKSALAAVRVEFMKWGTRIWPTMMTYEEMRKRIDNWVDGELAPQGIVFDESSKVKTPTALRSKAAKDLADGMRSDYGDDCFIILMSGTPAPKSPLDWYHQCEIACPGFIKEGTFYSFRDTVAVYEDRRSKTGGTYPHLVCWKDNDHLCNVCGKPKADEYHDIADPDSHAYVCMDNEVARLYRRMKGLVRVVFKKDCLDLPEKIYRVIECTPDAATLRAAKLIPKRAPRAVTALMLLRELSDGFQYTEKKVGTQPCTVCNATGEIEQYENTPEPKGDEEEVINPGKSDLKIIGKMECPKCKGTKKEDVFERDVIEVDCPKVGALKELLEEHQDYGRLVVYGGFTASIDRVVNICRDQGWATFRVDGRGVDVRDADGRDMMMSFEEALVYFQEDKSCNMVFVGQPGAAGMGLTLTASPSIVYWSNDFNGENRVQSEDRIHRPGATGANIIDLIHLPTDLQVLENLKAKRNLELMSLGQLSLVLETAEEETENVR